MSNSCRKERSLSGSGQVASVSVEFYADRRRHRRRGREAEDRRRRTGLSAGDGPARRFRPRACLYCRLPGRPYYELTARNFNPLMAMAADIVLVQAQNVVPVGVVSPDHVVTPAPVVDFLVTGE